MSKTPPNLAMSADDAIFETSLKQVSPLPPAIGLDQLMYRAGYQAASLECKPQKTPWTSYLGGVFSGALAASVLVWLCAIPSMRLNDPEYLPNPTVYLPEAIQLPGKSHAITSKTDDMPLVKHSSIAGAVLVNGQETTTPISGSIDFDLFRGSLSKVSKREWDRWRLAEYKHRSNAQFSHSTISIQADPDLGKLESFLSIRNMMKNLIEL